MPQTPFGNCTRRTPASLPSRVPRYDRKSRHSPHRRPGRGTQLHLLPKSDGFTLHLQSDLGDFATISCSNQSGNSGQLRVNTFTAPLPGAAGSPVRLHLFLDGSVLEIFVNGTTSITARIYQTPSGPLRLKIEGDVELTSLDVWQMTPISKDRLTGSLCS